MESKKLIVCPECGETRNRTRQHRLRRSNGAILDPRNKKVECKECQDMFDNYTAETVATMLTTGKIAPSSQIQQNGKTYYVRNYSAAIPAGGTTLINTGSQVQSGYAEMQGAELSKLGSPISLSFAEQNVPNQDKIKISNNGEDNGIVFLSTVVDIPNDPYT